MPAPKKPASVVEPTLDTWKPLLRMGSTLAGRVPWKAKRIVWFPAPKRASYSAFFACQAASSCGLKWYSTLSICAAWPPPRHHALSAKRKWLSSAVSSVERDARSVHERRSSCRRAAVVAFDLSPAKVVALADVHQPPRRVADRVARLQWLPQAAWQHAAGRR